MGDLDPERAPPVGRADTKEPLPAGFGLAPDPTTRALERGRVLLGGSPTRLLRLSRRAAVLTAAWFAGAPVSADHAERRLARRLVAAALAHPRPPASANRAGPVTVVVPVRDRPEQLARLLASLDGGEVVVVDDGSHCPARVEAVTRRFGARRVVLEVSHGPAAARNAGLAACSTPFVAFVDSDCTVSPGWLDPLLAHFDDPVVGAVAPRIVPGPPTGRRWLDSYESVRSPLDRGDRQGLVRPGSPVHFVPTAALVVRRRAVGERCFDEHLGAGEDVDFVWRLSDAGWDVRYDPSSTVRHESRPDARRWLAQRAGYGATAGPLARRHGHRLAPFSVPAWTAGALALVAAGKRAATVAVVATSTSLLARRLRSVVDRPLREAALLAVPGSLRALAPAWEGLARAYSPAAAAALTTRRARRAGLVALVAPGLVDWWRLRPPLDPLRFTLVHAADDLAYGCGLWLGCVRARTVRPVVPYVPVSRAGTPSPGTAPPGTPSPGTSTR